MTQIPDLGHCPNWRYTVPGTTGINSTDLVINVFSGGAAKGADAVYDDARAIRDGGGNGSIIGRNSFQRERGDALAMLSKLVDIYRGKDGQS